MFVTLQRSEVMAKTDSFLSPPGTQRIQWRAVQKRWDTDSAWDFHCMTCHQAGTVQQLLFHGEAFVFKRVPIRAGQWPCSSTKLRQHYVLAHICANICAARMWSTKNNIVSDI